MFKAIRGLLSAVSKNTHTQEEAWIDVLDKLSFAYQEARAEIDDLLGHIARRIGSGTASSDMRESNEARRELLAIAETIGWHEEAAARRTLAWQDAANEMLDAQHRLGRLAWKHGDPKRGEPGGCGFAWTVLAYIADNDGKFRHDQ